MRRRLLDLLSAVAFLLAIGVMAWQSHVATFFPAGPGLAHDPVFYPRVLLAVAALLATVLLVQSLLRLREPERAQPLRWRILLGMILATSGYVLLLPVLGYALASGLFVLTASLVLGYRRWLPVSVVVVLFPLVSWYVFVAVMGIPLPAGELVRLR